MYTNSRADLELKYVYAKLGTSEAYKLCPVDPPPADIDVTNPSNASIGFHSYEKVDNLITTYVNLLSAHSLIGFNIQPLNWIHIVDMSPLIHIKRSFLKIPKEILQPGDKIVSTSTTEPSPDCQQLVERNEVGRQKKEKYKFWKIIFRSINKHC